MRSRNLEADIKGEMKPLIEGREMAGSRMAVQIEVPIG